MSLYQKYRTILLSPVENPKPETKGKERALKLSTSSMFHFYNRTNEITITKRFYHFSYTDCNFFHFFHGSSNSFIIQARVSIKFSTTTVGVKTESIKT